MKTRQKLNKPKRQHWVPRFYLKEFAIDRDAKTPQVWIFSRHEGDPALVNIDKIAAKNYLYSPKDPNANRSWETEEKLADLEGLMSQMWPVFARGVVDLNNEGIRKGLSLFVATLILRHPLRKKETDTLHRQLVDMFESVPKDKNGNPAVTHVETKSGVHKIDTSDWKRYRNPTEYDRSMMFIDGIHQHATDIAWILMDKRWSVVISEEPNFITSDNPVVVMNTLGNKKGLGVKGTRIQFPLSPTRTLVMDDMYDQPASQYYPLHVDGPAVYNIPVWTEALNFMISTRHTDQVCLEFEVLRKIIETEESQRC